MKRILLTVIAFALIIASCGGGDEPAPEPATPAPAAAPQPVGDPSESPEPAATAAPGSGGSATPAPTPDEPAPDPAPDQGAGASSDFCGFIATVDTESDNFGFDPEAFRTAMEEVVASMQRARDLAPREISADVETVLNSFLGFVELLEEYDYNLIATGTSAENDPRLLVFEDAEYLAAIDRIGAFCGLDLTGEEDDPDPVIPPGGGQTGGPEGLVPPNVTQTIDVSPVVFVFISSASYEDLVEFYTGALGNPLLDDRTQKTAVWNGFLDGTMYSVGVTEAGGMIEVVVTRVG